MSNAGTITFSTAIDNSQLEKDLKEAEREVKDLKDKIENGESTKTTIEVEIDDSENKVRQLEATLQGLIEKKRELQSINAASTDYDVVAQTSAEITSINQKIDQTRESISEQISKTKELYSEWNKANDAVGEYQSKLANVESRQRNLGKDLGQSYKESASEMSGALRTAEGKFTGFSTSMSSVMAKSLMVATLLSSVVLSAFSGIAAAIGSYLSDAIQENEQLAATFNGLKATVEGFASGLISALLPAISAVIRALTALMVTLARVVDMIFSTNIASTIQSTQAAAGATKSQAKAAKQLAKEQKEANKQLMSFDEINKLNDNEDDTSSGGSGGGGGGANPFDVGTVDDALAQIMAIVGAALLAVGAILAFSGINIPLGLSLMAIGALMIYSVATENWGQLPEEVRQAITTAITITGIVLVVLGIILAFSGAATPLGIGMLVAGASLLWAAVGLNWKNLPSQVQSTITAIVTVVSVAFLVLGAVLAFSGAALPLGIALMAIGAASLVAVAAINWENMPTEVRNTISSIMAIVGVAFLVLGVVLLFTGVAAPLGIALIAMGAGSLASAIALNWDFVRDKIKEVWNSIVSFWNSHIAPVFTIEFWANLFKCIVNGLISMINRGLNAFGSFVNAIASGISGILSAFDIEASWHFTMPQIPYLAQGAVIPPNRKFLAMLGDQSSGNNLEAPEGLIRQIVREEAGAGSADAIASAVQQGVVMALMQAGALNRSSSGDSDLIVVLQVGNEELARAVNKGNERLAYRGEYTGAIEFV